MVMSDDAYRAIEILRFLREASASDPWTASELALVIQAQDENINSRLWGRFRLDKGEENHQQLHRTAKEILAEMSASGRPIPSLAGTRNTLAILKRRHWVQAARGKGYLLSKAGRSVSLLDILHACGDHAAVTRCTHETQPLPCPFMQTCTSYKFYKALGAGLAEAYSQVTIEDIASGTCRIEVVARHESEAPVEDEYA